MNDVEIIDRLCEVTTLQNDIIREQAMIIKQHGALDACEGKRECADKLLDRIECALRRS